MSDAFIAEIRLFGGNFAPRTWATPDGQILAISQNTALFSLLGTTYGGNGTSTFQLPDFRGRTPIQQGQGAGLSSYSLGQTAGSAAFNLSGASTAAAPDSPIQAITFSGNAIPTQSPFLVLTFIIALQGVFPARP